MTPPNTGEDVEPLDTLACECGIVQPFRKKLQKKKLKIQLPLNPGIIVLGIYPRERKSSVHKKSCTQISTAALFIRAKHCNQHRRPSTDECLNQLWYIPITDYYSAITRGELLIYRTAGMTLQRIMLSMES